MQARESFACLRLTTYSPRIEPKRSRRAALRCSRSRPHGPALRPPVTVPPSSAISSSRRIRSLSSCTNLLGPCRDSLGALHRLLQRDFRCFVCLSGVIASRRGVLRAGLVGAFIALFGGGAVALGGAFVLVRGGCVCVFRQWWTPFRSMSVHHSLARECPVAVSHLADLPCSRQRATRSEMFASPAHITVSAPPQ
jgi:hypothetical protein